MSRIKEIFTTLSEKNESALITYLTAGYPTLESSMEYIEKLLRYADIIEIGIPFSDPIADGKTIQYASYIALKNGFTLSSTLRALSQLKIDKALVIMSYLNPLIAFGIEDFFKEIGKIGVSGLIVPDIVVEESERLKDLAHRHYVDLIQLIAPTSNDERIKLIGKMSDGFVYCVSITGTTGVRKKLPESLPLFIKRVKSLVDIPVVIGFGISKTNQIKYLSKIADGVVIGSRIIEAIRNRENLDGLIKESKKATIRKLL
uniref:Tryptophan synthase alpha chain n=1 Tax=candidate division WOR-3 bacterium TaxID=2052148 RepID=A0A7C6EKB9_UNCW3